MNRATILQVSLLCSFSLINCMEITKCEKTYSAIQLHDILKFTHKDPDRSLAATKLFHTHNGNLNIQSPKGYTFLMEAVHKKNIPLMKYLLENNADPNIPTHDYTYPIHLAIEFDDYYCVNKKPTEIVLEIVALLLQHGADPNHQYSRYQVLPLDVARLRKRAIIIKELKKYNAKSINEIQKEKRNS